MKQPRIVVFDVGNVLVDWNPRYLYRTIFPDDSAKMEWFLGNICTGSWNLEQDRGRSFKQAANELSQAHPEHQAAIHAFDLRWHETISGEITGTVEILAKLRQAGTPNYAITNFNQDKFRETKLRFPFLDGFKGTIVSGDERVVKPDAAIYELLLSRYSLDAADCIFIDDSLKNVEGARAVGMHAHHFETPDKLTKELRGFGFAA